MKRVVFLFHHLNADHWIIVESPIMAHFHFYAIFVNHRFGLFVTRAAALWTCNYTRHLASNDIDVDLRFSNALRTSDKSCWACTQLLYAVPACMLVIIFKFKFVVVARIDRPSYK